MEQISKEFIDAQDQQQRRKSLQMNELLIFIFLLIWISFALLSTGWVSFDLDQSNPRWVLLFNWSISHLFSSGDRQWKEFLLGGWSSFVLINRWCIGWRISSMKMPIDWIWAIFFLISSKNSFEPFRSESNRFFPWHRSNWIPRNAPSALCCLIKCRIEQNEENCDSIELWWLLSHCHSRFASRLPLILHVEVDSRWIWWRNVDLVQFCHTCKAKLEQTMSTFISSRRLIVAEDLLDNNAMLWKIFESVNEEETKIIDWLMKRVLRNSNVSLKIEKRSGGIQCQISFTGIEYSLGQTSVDPLGEGVKKISSVVFDEEQRKTSILFLTRRRVESEPWSKSLEEMFPILTNKQISPLIDVDLTLTVYPWTLEMDQSSQWKRREIWIFEFTDRRTFFNRSKVFSFTHQHNNTIDIPHDWISLLSHSEIAGDACIRYWSSDRSDGKFEDPVEMKTSLWSNIDNPLERNRFSLRDRVKGRCPLIFLGKFVPHRSTTTNVTKTSGIFVVPLSMFKRLPINHRSFKLEIHSDWISIRRIVQWSLVKCRDDWCEEWIWRCTRARRVCTLPLSSSASSKSN